MKSTKTTFYLTEELRRRLKGVAAQQGKSVKDLLAEGAEMVLARYQSRKDRDELKRRAAEARQTLRAGLYEGPAIASTIDDLLYAAEPAGTLRRSPK